MQRHSSLIATLYDEDSNIVTVCCTICGAATCVEATLETEDEEMGMMVKIDHLDGCELALSHVKGRH